jgi:transposase
MGRDRERSAKRERREFSKEFKLEAVRLATSGEKPLAQVAREIGIHPNLLSSWKREAASTGLANDVFPGNGKLTSQDEEIRRLRRELAIAREERDFLKKATAFFAKESR